MKKRILSCVLILATVATHVEAQAPAARSVVVPETLAAEDKKSLVDQIIPKQIQEISDVVGKVVGIFNNFKGAIDVLGSIGQALGIFSTSKQPTLEDLFKNLSMKLDNIAGSLDWKISTTARATRYGKVMSAFYSAMQAMQSGDLSDEILAEADSDSKEVVFELEDPSEVAFLRFYNESVTSGDWTNVIAARPEISSDGQVYDWRKAIPEFLHYLAVRLTVMSAMDGEWKLNQHFRSEIIAHRDFLLRHIDKMSKGVVCGGISQGTACPAEGCLDQAVVQLCADIYSGISSSVGYVGPVGPPDVYFVEINTKNRMPLFQMQAIADQLDIYANPEKADPDHNRIFLTASGFGFADDQPLGCLDTQAGGAADGTPIVISECAAGSATQDWHYDRQNSRIYNPSLDKCLDLRDGLVADDVQIQVYSCWGGEPQRWWLSSQGETIQSFQGTYLGMRNLNGELLAVGHRLPMFVSLEQR